MIAFAPLFAALLSETTLGEVPANVAGVAFDSRRVVERGVFVAVRGTQTDGHDYIETALQRGARVIVCETLPDGATADFAAAHNVAFVRVVSSSRALGRLADALYDHPSRKLKLVGVTGTNGKTTTATLLYRLYTALGHPVGLLSTIENKILDRTVPATHTTPDALTLNELLAEMVEAGCEYAFMEVSSHALSQGRTAGIYFTGAVFTNLTHDHLDYHGTFKNYLEAKKILFNDLQPAAFALSNIDDRNGGFIMQNSRATRHTYALRNPADYKGRVMENTLTGLLLDLDGTEVHARLVGEFNAYNLLAVYATARLLGSEKTEILPALSNLTAAEGRFETIIDPERRITIIIDYAHTPDALEKVLETIHEATQIHAKGTQKGVSIITVVGCGGDRDRTKRPVMAAAALRLSDIAIFTSDNPRTENPADILADMHKGIAAADEPRAITIPDRTEAIRIALDLAETGDTVLIAGKGHEKYQEINGIRYDFDDREVVKRFLVC